MWSNDIRKNLAKELEEQLDNKNFFDAKAYYNSVNNKIENKDNNNESFYIMPNSQSTTTSFLNNEKFDYNETVKGMSFAKKQEKNDTYYESAMSFKGKKQEEKKLNSIDNLSLENRKIYEMKDLINKDLAETIVFPIQRESVPVTSLAVITRPAWKELLFADIGAVWKMIKNKLGN